MGVKKYGGSLNSQTRAQAKAEAKFRTEKGGVEVYGKLDTTAINRIFALDPTIKTWDDFQRRAKIEIERVAAGSGDSTFSSGLVSHQKITDGKRTDCFSPDGHYWTSKRTEDRSGRLDSDKGEGSRADRSINVDRTKPAAAKKVSAKYVQRVELRTTTVKKK